MKAIISRSYEKNYTKGSFLAFEGCDLMFRCKTLELPDNGNQRNVSCIPEGVYTVIRHKSPTKGECFWLQDVKDRDSILIHSGNYAVGTKVDTKGCILVGNYFEDLNHDGNIDIAESKKALSALLEIMPDEFSLIII